jgi:hypothetical protein
MRRGIVFEWSVNWCWEIKQIESLFPEKLLNTNIEIIEYKG